MLPKLSQSTQKGYVALAVIVFMLLISAFIFPWKFPKKGNTECVLGDPPDGNSPVLQLPVAENFGPSPTKKSDFILVRSNVPTSDELDFFKVPSLSLEPNEDDAHLIQVDNNQATPGFDDNPQKPGYDEFYPYGGANGKVYPEWEEAYIGLGYSLIDLGLVFFRNNDPKAIREIPGVDPQKVNRVYSVDIYQDKQKMPQGQVAKEVTDLLECANGQKGTRIYNASKTIPTVAIPAQNKSSGRDQLQLEWFLFQSNGVWAVHCKPAVYLYPPKKQLVNIKVFPKGELSYTDPSYDSQRGWTVEAFPNGKLNVFSRQPSAVSQFDYLYYESKLLDSEIKKPTEGWVVKSEAGVKNKQSLPAGQELRELLERILPKLGLNQKEKADFMNYWLTKLPKSPYYFVGLIEKNQRDYLEALEVTPNPETSIRFSLYFEALDEPRAVTEPKITTPERTGFTLVDWGGMIELHPGTPFTCSQ